MSLSIGGGARIGLGRWAFGVLFGGAAGTYAAPMLVGRDAELCELLGAAATALAGGRGWTALVGGDAGIGKTGIIASGS